MSDTQGSFVTGLTVGLFAGAAGYFLFGTRDGKQLRKQLEKEWQTSQLTSLANGHQIDPKIISTRSLFHTFKQIMTQMAEQQPVQVAQSAAGAAAKKNKKPPSTAAKKADGRFKGV